MKGFFLPAHLRNRRAYNNTKASKKKREENTTSRCLESVRQKQIKQKLAQTVKHNAQTSKMFFCCCKIKRN